MLDVTKKLRTMEFIAKKKYLNYILKTIPGTNYFRIESKHIFLGIRNSTTDSADIAITNIINLISQMKNQDIHIFVSNILSTEDRFVNAVKAFRDANHKVYIYIPSQCKDLRKIVNSKLYRAGVSGYYVYGMRNPIGFRITVKDKTPESKQHREYLWIYDNGHYMIEASISYGIDSIMTSDDNAAIQNEAQSENPELFKDKIISNFKANTPMKMLKTFKDEEDIWKYINVLGDWSSKDKPKHIIEHTMSLNIDLTNEELMDDEKIEQAAVNAMKDVLKTASDVVQKASN